MKKVCQILHGNADRTDGSAHARKLPVTLFLLPTGRGDHAEDTADRDPENGSGTGGFQGSHHFAGHFIHLFFFQYKNILSHFATVMIGKIGRNCVIFP